MKPQKKTYLKKIFFDPQLFDDQLIIEKPYVENLIHTPFESNINLLIYFSGIGGFHFNLLASSSKKIKEYIKLFLASEIEKVLQKCLSKKYLGSYKIDINKININDYNFDADILYSKAGFPCQPFSKIQMQKGLTDLRDSFIIKLRNSSKNLEHKLFRVFIFF